MNRKEAIMKGTQRQVEMAMLLAQLGLLFDPEQDYTDCLTKLLDQDIILDKKYRISQFGSRWEIESFGDKSWHVKFFVVDNKIKDFIIILAFCHRVDMINDFKELVIHLLSSYHSNGKELFEEVKG